MKTIVFALVSIGVVTRTCNSTRQHAIEIINTITQLRDLSQFVNTDDTRPELHELLSSWILRRPSRVKKETRLLHQLPNRSVPSISIMWRNQRISYYSTVYIGHVRVTTAALARGKRANDSSIIVRINRIEHFAVVEEIFSVDERDAFLRVCCLSKNRSFVCSTGKTQITFDAIQRGSMGDDCVVPLRNFVEKCVRIDHSAPCSVTFVRFPNLCDSS